MAAEDIRPSGRGWLAAGVESTYGVDANPSPTADAIYAEEPEANQETEALERTGEAPRRPGWRSVDGPETNTVGFQTEIRAMSVVDANSRPHEHALLVAIGGPATPGFQTVGTLNILSYPIQDFGYSGVTVDKYEENINGDGNGTLKKLVGCRGTGEYQKENNQKIMVQSTLTAKSWSVSDYTGIAINDIEWNNSNGVDRLPMVYKAATIVISTMDGLTVYEGGVMSAAAPLEMNPEIHRVANSSSGIERVWLRPDVNMMQTFVVEAIPIADFDPYALRLARTVVKIVERIPAQDSVPVGKDYVEFVSYATIRSITNNANVDGRRAWEFEMEMLWGETTPGDPGDPTVVTGGSNDAATKPNTWFEMRYVTDTSL